MDTSFFEAVLFHELGVQHTLKSFRSIGGGCINNGTLLETSQGQFFLKWNQHEVDDLFEKETEGLQRLRESQTLQVPEVVGFGMIGQTAYLLQHFMQSNTRAQDFWQHFGLRLAQLHRCNSDRYGLDTNNHIGRLIQKNDLTVDWIQFFIDHRLEVQLGLALSNRHVDTGFVQRFRNLYAQLPGLLSIEPPSLLHGDLWNGNFLVGAEGHACLIDPAVYYGNREIEMAFTTLFGGFDPEFYQTYFEAFPVEPGFEERIDIYNLYPLLVHVNLFGPSYLNGIFSVLNKYC